MISITKRFKLKRIISISALLVLCLTFALGVAGCGNKYLSKLKDHQGTYVPTHCHIQYDIKDEDGIYTRGDSLGMQIVDGQVEYSCRSGFSSIEDFWGETYYREIWSAFLEQEIEEFFASVQIKGKKFVTQKEAYRLFVPKEDAYGLFISRNNDDGLDEQFVNGHDENGTSYCSYVHEFIREVDGKDVFVYVQVIYKMKELV